MSWYGCVAKGSATTDSEGGLNNGLLLVKFDVLGSLSIFNCNPHHTGFYLEAPHISIHALAEQLITEKSLQSLEFEIKLADYNLGSVEYILGRAAFELADERIVDRPVVSVNSSWLWNQEGLSFEIAGNCGFPKPSVPELRGHKRGDSYEVKAQILWADLPELFRDDFLETMKGRSGASTNTV
jgi:hypothetical protein